MHRVSAFLPSWDRSRPQPDPAPRAAGALEKVFGWAEKIVVPVNRTSAPPTAPPARYGRETYWPTTLDKECDKAARIIKSFCFDGFLSQEPEQTDANANATATAATPTTTTTAEQPATPKYVTQKIPARIIQNAVGLAVFSCMRSGLWMSGSGGAGLITARKADGTWSPPSAIILHTAELAFVMGVDIYDCVLVINSVQTLELFTRPRLILGVDVSLTVGPLVGSAEPDIRWKEISETVLTYVKARGRHQAVQLDGSLVTERSNENERFYCSNVTILDVLAGNIPKSIPEMRPLFEVIKAAEGRSDYDKALMEWLAQQPAPGDAEIETPAAPVVSPAQNAFGVPDANDPDPFGVIGLEMAGIEIREAGSTMRPASTQLEYRQSPTSPVFAGRFSRQSIETFVSRSNRGSGMSSRTHATAATDVYTQTDVASTADTSFSRPNSDDGKDGVDKLPTVLEPDEVDYTQVDMSFIERLGRRTVEVSAVPEVAPAAEVEVEKIKEVEKAAEARVVAAADEAKEEKPAAVGSDRPNETPGSQAADERDDGDADDEDEDAEEDEEPIIICEVATASAQPTRSSIRTSQITQAIPVKGALVTIPKRIPPPLPARSPARASRGSRDMGDVSSLRSPIRSSFLSVESHRDYTQRPAESPSAAETVTTAPAPNPTKPEEPPLPQHPASPRHQKNSSSVSTAVAITPAEIPTPPSAQDHDTPSPSPVPPTSRTPEPASSADDESEREPRTPQTGEDETRFLPPRHQHRAGKGAGEMKDADADAGVRIVSPSGTGPAGEGAVAVAVAIA
ncbi:hypothetical protein BT67DRAFT_390921 [Trichocladium antarcticum]|uniref:Ysc84 actin-binding domain-containing protein n=1 Tax=Trichocladium antarcticum TaxID=1450529 RepID=A0AAN6UCM3_9PEZI|nr:hypothetical protein BT67DRAFT_390921 [Trichocladium antarcticum]